MKTKKLIPFFLVLLLSPAIWAENEKKSALAYNGFSGGMQLHTGFVQSREFSLYNTNGTLAESMTLKGAPFGIGGCMRVHFGKFLRVGGEGYISTLNYKNGSYTSVGWGGLLADFAYPKGRWTPFVGATFGGGHVKNLTMLDAPQDDYQLDERTSFRSYAFLALTPFVGVEYAASKRIHLMLKVDYITNLNNRQDDFVTGPRVYFGFVFAH